MTKEFLELCISQGMTQREIGRETGMSQTTVRYWLRRHELLKARLVKEAGGQCQICGYSRSMWLLQSHHRDAVTKEYEIGLLIRDREYSAAEAEAIKCDLLCANCHGETEEQKWNETVV